MSIDTTGSPKNGNGILGFSTNSPKNSLDGRELLGSKTSKENLENSSRSGNSKERIRKGSNKTSSNPLL